MKNLKRMTILFLYGINFNLISCSDDKSKFYETYDWTEIVQSTFKDIKGNTYNIFDLDNSYILFLDSATCLACLDEYLVKAIEFNNENSKKLYLVLEAKQIDLNKPNYYNKYDLVLTTSKYIDFPPNYVLFIDSKIFRVKDLNEIF
jgi:hypothetical protein